MATARRPNPTKIADKVLRRHGTDLLELRDHLAPHPGPERPVPPGRLNGWAVSQSETQISVLASALLLDYDHLPPTTEWRVSVAAFSDPEHRVPVQPGEAAGWARAVVGEPLLEFLYRHHDPLSFAVQGHPAAQFVLYLGPDGPIHPDPDLPTRPHLRRA